MLGSILLINTDLYINPRFEGNKSPITNTFPIQHKLAIDKLPAFNKSKLLYHVNKFTGVHWLCIPLLVTPDILAIAYGEGHPSFSCCYKIIARCWLIRSLTKFFPSFIWHCLQCLTLQTKQHPSYRSLQPIESLPVFFSTLTLDFIFALPLTKKKFNPRISLTYKVSKRVIFLESANTWPAENWIHAFLKKLDLIDWGLLRESISNCGLKFLNRF